MSTDKITIPTCETCPVSTFNNAFPDALDNTLRDYVANFYTGLEQKTKPIENQNGFQNPWTGALMLVPAPTPNLNKLPQVAEAIHRVLTGEEIDIFNTYTKEIDPVALAIMGCYDRLYREKCGYYKNSSPKNGQEAA